MGWVWPASCIPVEGHRAPWRGLSTRAVRYVSDDEMKIYVVSYYALLFISWCFWRRVFQHLDDSCQGYMG